jgi:hypothetical protein
MQWLKQASCRAIPTDEFFEGFEEKKAAERAKILSVCASCPVRSECQDYAESSPHTYGLWAGYFYRNGVRRDAMKIKRKDLFVIDQDSILV